MLPLGVVLVLACVIATGLAETPTPKPTPWPSPVAHLERYKAATTPAKQMKFFNESLALYGAKDDAEWEARVNGFLGKKKELRIFLGHGGVVFHGEVFYSVANKVSELMPLHDITFYISDKFGQTSGIDKLWGKYAETGPIRNLKYEIAFLHEYADLDVACNRESITTSPYMLRRNEQGVWGNIFFDMHVQVTVQDHNHFGCMPLYQDDPRYMIIMHHAEGVALESNGHQHFLMSSFRNAFVASGSETIKNLTQRHFVSSLMPILPTNPICSAPPVFVVQGSLSRRNMTELKVLFDIAPPLNFLVKVRSKSKMPFEWFTNDKKRGDFVAHADMTAFHEMFVGAAFILPLIPGAGDGDPRGYLHNHPTSSIAYAANFGLRVVGHKDVPAAYPEALGGRLGHYHDGTDESVSGAFSEAVASFVEYCNQVKRLSGEDATTEKLIDLWLYGSVDAPTLHHEQLMAWEGPHSVFLHSRRKLLKSFSTGDRRTRRWYGVVLPKYFPPDKTIETTS